jgi:mono/diheme cytochrome c family protein
MRRVSLALVGAGVVLLSVTGLRAQNPGGSAAARQVKNPVAMSAASIAAGKALYTRNCRFCHGDDAKGNGQMAPKDSHPSDLTDAKWDRGSTDGEIFAVLRDGAGPEFKMKGYKGRLSDTDMWNTVNYLRSLGPTSSAGKKS